MRIILRNDAYHVSISFRSALSFVYYYQHVKKKKEKISKKIFVKRMNFKSRKLTDRDIPIFIFNIDRKYSLKQLLKQILKNNLIIKKQQELHARTVFNYKYFKNRRMFRKVERRKKKKHTNFDKLKKYVSTVRVTTPSPSPPKIVSLKIISLQKKNTKKKYKNYSRLGANNILSKFFAAMKKIKEGKD